MAREVIVRHLMRPTVQAVVGVAAGPLVLREIRQAAVALVVMVRAAVAVGIRLHLARPGRRGSVAMV